MLTSQTSGLGTLSLPTLGAAVAIFALVLLILKPIITYLRDPLDLRKFPAPSFLAATTPLWKVRQTLTERRSRIIHEEHQRLGDVIRIAPNHLIFNDARAVKDIYGVTALNRVAKDSFYDRLSGDHHDLVVLRDRKEHARRRKALTNAFALKTVVNMEPVIADKAYQLLERIDARCDGKEGIEKQSDGVGLINIRRWFNYFTMDVIGDMAFGLPMGFLEKGNDIGNGETKGGVVYPVASTISSIHWSILFGISLSEMGSLSLNTVVKRALRVVPPLARKLGLLAGDDFENVCINQLRNRLKNGPPNRPSGDFMSFVLDEKEARASDEEKGAEIPFGELTADSVMMMNAGSDTTAAALSNTLYLLLANPHCLEKLRREVDEQIPFKADEDIQAAVSAFSSVGTLPYLRACIDESLRLRPPIAFQLPRLVHAPEGATIAGHHIKQGTIVAVSPFSIHRNKDLYSDPDTFNPDRWTDEADLEQQQRLKSYTIPFSQGSRACIGRHIAIVELQMLISTLVRRYDMSFSKPNQTLETFDRFNANPGPLPIHVKRRVEVAAAA